MRNFTCINDEFGDVEETGIMITIQEIFEEKGYATYRATSKSA